MKAIEQVYEFLSQTGQDVVWQDEPYRFIEVIVSEAETVLAMTVQQDGARLIMSLPISPISAFKDDPSLYRQLLEANAQPRATVQYAIVDDVLLLQYSFDTSLPQDDLIARYLAQRSVMIKVLDEQLATLPTFTAS